MYLLIHLQKTQIIPEPPIEPENEDGEKGK